LGGDDCGLGWCGGFTHIYSFIYSSLAFCSFQATKS
jgi:hypothetical protein